MPKRANAPYGVYFFSISFVSFCLHMILGLALTLRCMEASQPSLYMNKGYTILCMFSYKATVYPLEDIYYTQAFHLLN